MDYYGKNPEESCEHRGSSWQYYELDIQNHARVNDVICSSFEWFTSFVHIHWHEVLHVVHLILSFSTSEWETGGCEWTPERILPPRTLNYNVRWRMCTRLYLGPVVSLILGANERFTLTTYYIMKKGLLTFLS